MDFQDHFERYIPQTRKAFALGMAIALSVLAATVFSGLVLVRSLVRAQIVQRDAVALHDTTLMEQLDIEAMEDGGLRTREQVSFDAAVRSSRLRNVLGIRFYDAAGRFYDAFPPTIQPQPLGNEAFSAARNLEPYGRYVPDTRMDDIFIYLPQFATGQVSRVPTLLATVPLHRHGANEFFGAAQFVIEGYRVADEYARLDRRLAAIAGATFLVAALLLMAMLWPAFRRLQRLNRSLAQHAQRLQRANEELALAARVSAVGAVSAHLMHGLRNPLASLSQFIRRQGDGDGGTDRDEIQDALTASRRMQALIERTVEVVGDARGEPAYELTVLEMGDDVRRRVAAEAAARGVQVGFQAEGNCTVSSRTANLAGLILVNLLENAIQATPAGGVVALSVSRDGDRLCFRIRDGGGGFPSALREHLFLPGRSSREGGSGIGLAISKQIADFLGAELVLEESSAAGCVFLLELPMSVCLDPPC